MRIEWVCKKGTPGITVFFNGWGMDVHAVRHLEPEEDLLVLSDYRQPDTVGLPSLVTYDRIRVVAWSMGVWAAARILPEWGIRPACTVAINGTACPIHDAWGIPSRIYALTERGMNIAGREKFIRRMFANEEEIHRFLEHPIVRPIEEVCEELTLIREQSTARLKAFPWNKVYVSSGDLIFPTTNQQAYWNAQGIIPISLGGGHYPFYRFSAWEEILQL